VNGQEKWLSAAPGPIARRPKDGARRPFKVGPLALSAAELADVRRAAARAGLAPGAYAAQVVVAVARQEITVLPTDVRALLLELVQARAELGAVGALLRAAGERPGTPAPIEAGTEAAVEEDTVAVRLRHAMRRLEDAADALAGQR
jgi:hypothetical protein